MTFRLDQYASQYASFENERTRPVRDLVAAIPPRIVKRMVDLGCGPGNSTEVLAGRFPEASLIGLDSSADMVAAAKKRLPNLSFEVSNIARWEPVEQFDIILANAVLQWLPDHSRLYPRLLGKLAPGGVLAVQTPDNTDEPAQHAMRRLAKDGPWSSKLENVKREPREAANWYYDLLHSECSSLDIWRTTYFHPLAGGAAAVVEWFKGSSLRPFLAPLDAQERSDFLDRYTREIATAYPALQDGTVLLPFPRLFIVATRR
jgi:trans-aconitate 2-methyltransferase